MTWPNSSMTSSAQVIAPTAGTIRQPSRPTSASGSDMHHTLRGGALLSMLYCYYTILYNIVLYYINCYC